MKRYRQVQARVAVHRLLAKADSIAAVVAAEVAVAGDRWAVFVAGRVGSIVSVVEQFAALDTERGHCFEVVEVDMSVAAAAVGLDT